LNLSISNHKIVRNRTKGEHFMAKYLKLRPKRLLAKTVGSLWCQVSLDRKCCAALKQFTAAGWLSHTYRSITISDVKALRDYAESDKAD
jgi:hypothetical protein